MSIKATTLALITSVAAFAVAGCKKDKPQNQIDRVPNASSNCIVEEVEGRTNVGGFASHSAIKRYNFDLDILESVGEYGFAKYGIPFSQLSKKAQAHVEQIRQQLPARCR